MSTMTRTIINNSDTLNLENMVFVILLSVKLFDGTPEKFDLSTENQMNKCFQNSRTFF